MGIQLEVLEAEALKLTLGERAAFAQLLLASLDEDAEIEEAWAAEVERRIADVESGRVQVSVGRQCLLAGVCRSTTYAQ